MTDVPFKCCGCGLSAPDLVKPCNCATGVGFRMVDGKMEHKSFINRTSFDEKLHVPGLWRCAKCNFVLVQSNMNANTGSITARDDAGDRCPNDNVPLWRVSWQEHAKEMSERCEQAIVEAAALRSQVETMRKALEEVSRIPHMPFPDSMAHSWHATGLALHKAWFEIQQIVGRALNNALSSDDTT